ncbi:hypothetical protein [Succinimonas amylolytica]|uniref:hypothetical protein n=1 Tax=Succinimonas amylolytica TaxID=83769 RepID=UPI0023A8C6FB
MRGLWNVITFLRRGLHESGYRNFGKFIASVIIDGKKRLAAFPDDFSCKHKGIPALRLRGNDPENKKT